MIFLTFNLIFQLVAWNSLYAEAKKQTKNNRIVPIEVELPKKPAHSNNDLWSSTPVLEHVVTDKNKGVRIEDIVDVSSDYHYASFGNADPFVPPLLAAPQNKQPTVSKQILSPLQNYPSNQIKISGVWQTDEGEWKALAMTKEGEGIIVRKADPFGDKDGRITSIGEDGINIREYTKNLDGTREANESKIFLLSSSGTVPTSTIPNLQPNLQPNIQQPSSMDQLRNKIETEESRKTNTDGQKVNL